MSHLPPFDLLLKNYDTDPDPNAVKKRIGGEVTESWLGNNTCVMRLCKAFNYAGDPYRIRQGMGMEVVKGADKLWYGFKVQQFKQYLNKVYGDAKVIKEKGEKVDEQDFKYKSGIIGIDVSNWRDATGHFSLYDGSKIVYQGDHNYFSMSRVYVDRFTPMLTQVELWIC